MNTTSLTLLERLKQQHDDAAWSRLVELYTPMLFHWSRRTGLTETESEDLVQDVFLALLAKLSSFDRQQEGSFRKWLKVVTVNKCRERFRRRQFPVASGHGDFDPLNAVADPTTLAEFWEDDYRQLLVQRAMQIMQTDFSPIVWQACRRLSRRPSCSHVRR